MAETAGSSAAYPAARGGRQASDAATGALGRLASSAPYRGEGWVAAGDALAAFDPLSAMGIGHALSSGAHAGRVAEAALRGDREPQRQYQEAAEQIMRQYLNLRQRYYSAERRWPLHPFWKRR